MSRYSWNFPVKRVPQAYTYQKQKCFLPVKKMEDQIVFSLV